MSHLLSVKAEVDVYLAPFRLAKARPGPAPFDQVWILPEESCTVIASSSNYLNGFLRCSMTWCLQNSLSSFLTTPLFQAVSQPCGTSVSSSAARPSLASESFTLPGTLFILPLTCENSDLLCRLLLNHHCLWKSLPSHSLPQPRWGASDAPGGHEWHDLVHTLYSQGLSLSIAHSWQKNMCWKKEWLNESMNEWMDKICLSSTNDQY